MKTSYYHYLIVNILIVLLSHTSQVAFAQKDYIYGQVVDKLTNEIIKDALVVVKDHEGNVVDSLSSSNWGRVKDMVKPWVCFINKSTTKYTISVEKKGYDFISIDFKLKPSKRKFSYQCPTIKLTRTNEHQLDEVVVKATKVMFYSKGDTLVYNANAFQLSEGSMLDALIMQMPGVEFKDGVIYVNGKMIENLLLNGDDFFKGRNEVLLDNLPNYMVNQVKVYEKNGKLSTMVGHDMKDKEYVMDVVLKKQYQIGYIGNVEGGYGSEDRYLSRLFALRYTKQSRLSIYGNINNVNETRKPGGNGDWTPSNSKNGKEALKDIGIDYMIKDRLKRWEVNGSTSFKHNDYDGITNSSATLFTPTRNTFQKSLNKRSNSSSTLYTNHVFFFSNKHTQLNINPHFEYKSNHSMNNYSTLTFANNVLDNKSLLDSLMAPTISQDLWNNLSNRAINKTKSLSDYINTYLSVNLNQGFNTNEDVFQIQALILYNSKNNESFNHYLYEYSDPEKSKIYQDFKNRYAKEDPNDYLNYKIKTTYWFWFPCNLAIVPWYRYWNVRKRVNHGIYQLESMQEFSMDSKLGELPSSEELHQYIDITNSYNYTKTESEHAGGLNLQWEGNIKKGYMNFYISVPFRITTHNMNYYQKTIDSTFQHTSCFFEPEFTLRYRWNNWQKDLQLKYKPKASFANIEYFVPYCRNENPLYVYKGGSNLKDSYNHKLSIDYYYRLSTKGKLLHIGGAYNITQNKEVAACVYNRKTGVKTYSMQNVNGNYDFVLYSDYETPLNNKKSFILSMNTSYRFYNNVGYISDTYSDVITENMFVSNRSIVKTNLVTESLQLRWRLKQHDFRTFISGNWQYASSKRQNFNTINVFDYKYGVSAKVTLPIGLNFSSDISMYCRRGYNSQDMNSNDLVWNAQLSKSFFKNRVTMLIDGFDILHQLSSTTFTINGQGQTETFQNVIPHYVMCRVVYKLSMKPKKKT